MVPTGRATSEESASGPHAQHAIKRILDQIGRAIAGPQNDIDTRMAIQEIGQGRSDNQAADPPRHIHMHPPRQCPLILPEQAFGILDLCDDGQAALVEPQAVLRGRDPARRAMQQPGAQPRLQILNRERNRGTRQAELVSRTGEAAAIHHAAEGAEEVNPVHGDCLDYPTCKVTYGSFIQLA